MRSGRAADLPAVIRTTGHGVRPAIRTVTEGLRFIEDELPQELRRLPRWTFARELLEVAAKSRTKRDTFTAYRQLVQALGNDGLLADSGVIQGCASEDT